MTNAKSATLGLFSLFHNRFHMYEIKIISIYSENISRWSSNLSP